MLNPIANTLTKWLQDNYTAAEADALGFGWSVHPDVRTQPVLSGVDLLVVTSNVKVTRAVLAQVPAVLTTTSGYDHIDLDAAAELGVTVGRCPLARRDAVVEHALGAMLALGKRWPTQVDRARSGIWCRSELPALAPLGLRGSTVLVVGLGVIGRKLTKVLQALDVHVLGVDPLGVPAGVEAVELETGLQRCDAVTLHCSLTESSRNLLDADRLALLRPDAVVVNTARGDSLDVATAASMVNQGRLRGLAVDVFPQEPYPALAAESIDGVWYTAHAAGYAPDLGARVAAEVGAAFRALADGNPLPHVV